MGKWASNPANVERNKRAMQRREAIIAFIGDGIKSLDEIRAYIDKIRTEDNIWSEAKDVKNIIGNMNKRRFIGCEVRKNGRGTMGYYFNGPQRIGREITKINVDLSDLDHRLLAMMGIATVTPRSFGRRYTENDAIPQYEMRGSPSQGIQSSMG